MKTSILTLMTIILLSATAMADVTPQLTPEAGRITDAAIASDIAALAGLQKRLADVNSGGTPIGTYHFAKAQAWIDMAMDEYVMNDRTRVIEDTVRQAHELIVQLEEKKSAISMETPILPTSRIIRPDLWEKVEEWKKHPGFPCGEDLVAQLEVQLVWAGHEDNQLGWRHAKPYLQAAERLAREAGKKIESCPESERVKVAMGTAIEGGAAKAAAVAAQPESPSVPTVVAVPPVTPATVAAAEPPATPPAVAMAAKAAQSPAAACPPCAECPPCPAGSAVGTLPDRVHFALNRDIISPRSAAVLQRVVAVMKENPAMTVELRGHADERGHRVFNHVLSKHRAEVVRTYLVSSGVERGRIKVTASGASSPEKRGTDIVSYAKNRRVELVFSGAEKFSIESQVEDLQVEKGRP